MSFEKLGLNPKLLATISTKGYLAPTPIQEKAIPFILDGVDVLARAETGTGKTAAFALPILHRLNSVPAKNRRNPRVLVLTPTRELADQVGIAFQEYGRQFFLKYAIVFGGVKISPQVEKLSKGVDVLVATPGRLLDHLKGKKVDLSNIKMFVLDEADRMLDMGFIDAVIEIISYLPNVRQNLLFSATYTKDVKQLANKLLYHPEHVSVAAYNKAAQSVFQTLYKVGIDAKKAVLLHLLKQGKWSRTLVFTRTKLGANKVAEYLEKNGISNAAIHGNKSQPARMSVLEKFKKGEIRVLVATDVASRGLDIENVSHVVNYELPQVPEDYIHRIGRTGRAGQKGDAISLVCREENTKLKQIERHLKIKIPVKELKGKKGESISADSLLSKNQPGSFNKRYSTKPYNKRKRKK